MIQETKLSQSTIQSSTNSFFSDFSSSTKYNGLVEQSTIKVARNRLFQLMSYMDTSVPFYYALHEVITVWRFIQLIGPALAAGYDNFWENNSVAKTAVGIISIIFHFCPPKYRHDNGLIVEIIYVAIMLVFYIGIISAAFVYKKTAKLPKAVPPLLSLFISSIMFLIQPMALEMCGEEISYLIMNRKTQYHIGLEIFVILLVIALFAVSFWFYKNVTSISITFRPMSFISVLNNAGVYLTTVSYFITLITGIAAHLSQIPKIVLTIIAALLNLSLLLAIFMPGSFIKNYHNRLIFSASLSGGLHLFMVAIYLILGKHASQPQIFVFIALIIVSYIIAHFTLKKIELNQLVTLDEFIDNIENASAITSPTKMVQLLCTGMSNAHPVCIEWQLFNYAADHFPENVYIWPLFAKFTAIYPEETNLLSYIVRNIVAKKLAGSLAKNTVIQANQIQMQRENSLSNDLKRKIAHVQKENTSTKRRLRNIWDLVIQGNINDLEYSINNAYNSVNKTHNEFSHLISLYPNNRFVARGYARFLNEIMGDIQQYVAWQEKIRVLQRGIAVNTDVTNQMGLHAYPALPVTASKALGQTGIVSESESFSTLGDVEMDEETTQALTEHGSLIRSRIEELKIPAIRNIRIISLFLLIVLMIFPAVAILVYIPFYISSMTTPLEFMSYLSILRSFNFALPLWAHHWINENLPFPSYDNKPMFSKPNFTHIPTTLGGITDTFEQLKFILHECSANLEKLGTFRSFERDNAILAPVHKVVFETSLNYDYYTSINTSYKTTGSIMSFFLDHVIQISSLTEEELSFEMFNSPKLLNPYLNANSLAVNISDALICLTDYIADTSNTFTTIIRLVEIIVSIVYVVIWIVLLIVQLRKLKRNKMEIYKCLTALPKNVVSSMSEAMRVLKKDENDTSRTTEADTELNKQEENMLKIFASASDSNTSISADIIIFSICYMAMLVFAIIIIVVLCETFPSISETLTRNAPHLDDVMGTTAYMVGIFLALNNAVIANMNGYNGMVEINKGIGGRPILSSLERVSGRLETYLKYYHRARYGSEDLTEPPFEGYSEQIQKASEILTCDNTSEIYEDIHNTYSCFPVDSQILLFEPFVYKFIDPVVHDMPGGRIRTDDFVFVELWILACNLYDTLFYPMFDGIVPQMKDMMAAAIPKTQIPVIILLFLGLILTVIIIIQTVISESKMKFALRLLLHTQSKVVLQIPKINDVLSGDFSNRVKDTTQRTDIFFENVVQNLPDAIIIANQQYQVVTCNSAFERIFHTQAIEGDVREFFQRKNFNQDVSKIFTDSQLTLNIEYMYDETKEFLTINCGVVNNHYVIMVCDETQTVCYNSLIVEERAKSDSLLASILPANLVKRVQDGETNISFSVESATITFMDIVEFTPWCASNTAAVVMMTLNQLYKLFDASLAMKPTMTKIKCIGDCYMAAGGIFSEINEPNTHAREVVEFCLECINAVNVLDAEMNQTLRIRAGVNTGGPLVAGVIGTEKPTFEIIGPCINMAQQMEHNGMPMLVHISRSVYELIYGGDFKIRERGQIQIKNGDVITYFVEGRKEEAQMK